MAIEIARKQSQKTSSHDDLLQPVVYGVLPDQSNDEISLVDLFSKLASQWKLIAAIIVAGTLLRGLWCCQLSISPPLRYLCRQRVMLPL